MTSTICLIPARSGSVRIKDKNIRPILGTNILSHAVNKAISTERFMSVVCCTDSELYAHIAVSAGATVPGLRSEAVSTSVSPDYDWVSWAYEITNGFYGAEYFAILRPTAPFLLSSSIISAVNELTQGPSYESLRLVAQCSQHPFKMWTLKNMTLLPLFPFTSSSGIDLHSSQKAALPNVFAQTAGLDVSRTSVLTSYHNISGSIVRGYIVDHPESFDINTQSDWDVFESLASRYLISSIN
jgi:CMP-N,N'-diacetyllegionaminic acid synthase